jgi:hypothetical protein
LISDELWNSSFISRVIFLKKDKKMI